MPETKKQRGLKRYYQRLALKNEFDGNKELNISNPDTWPYNEHFHFDYKGRGNNSFKRRKPHLDKLFRHFDILIEKIQGCKTEFQLYAILLDYDSRSDALFFHKPNSNNSQFPFKVSDLQLTSTLKNKALNGYIDHLSGYEKRYGQAGEAFCLLFRKNVGQPFKEQHSNNAIS